MTLVKTGGIYNIVNTEAEFTRVQERKYWTWFSQSEGEISPCLQGLNSVHTMLTFPVEKSTKMAEGQRAARG